MRDTIYLLAIVAFAWLPAIVLGAVLLAMEFEW